MMIFYGFGVFDEFDEKFFYMFGMYGLVYVNMFMQEVDFIIVFGGCFDDCVIGSVVKFVLVVKVVVKENCGGIIYFEIFFKNINKVVQVIEVIEGDFGKNFDLFLFQVESKIMVDRKEWFVQINEWKKKWFFFDYECVVCEGLIKFQILIEEFSNFIVDCKENIYIIIGVGQYQMWVVQYFCWRYFCIMIIFGGFGIMGYGLLVVIGVKVVKLDFFVIDIDGDVFFGMIFIEFFIVVQFNIGVKIIVLNNEEQGMVI